MLRQVMSSILLFFIIFPSIIFGLKCGSGGICYGFKDVGTPFALEQKDCHDACVSFKCFVDDGQIMEGAGCYEDFANTCKYTRTEIKDQIKKNIKQSAIREYDVYFTSCSDEDGCATNGFDPWIINNSTDRIFGNSFNVKKGLPCKFDNQPIKYLPQVQCKTMTNCESGKEHKNGIYNHAVYGQNRTCDACIKFTCTLDGKTVTSGYGCYQDFEDACKFLGDDVKEKVKQNIKDSFYYDKNYIIFSCSDSDNCQIWSDSLLYYSQVNKMADTVLNVDFNSDKTCANEITTTSFQTEATTSQIETTTSAQVETSTSKNSGQTFASTVPQKESDQTDASEVFTTNNPPPSGAANDQFDAFILQEIIIFGFILIYLW